jgi:hypothetical protein
MTSRMRWAVGAVVLVPIAGLLLLLVRPLWEQRTFDAYRDRLRAEGRAIELTDLGLDMPSIEENAAYDYRLALDEMNTALAQVPELRDVREFKEWMRNPCRRDTEKPVAEWTDAELETLGRYIAELGPAWDYLRDGAAQSESRFVDYDSPAFLETLNKELGGVRSTARLIELRIHWELHHGRHDAALEWVGVGLSLVHQTSSEGTLIGAFVNVAVADLILGALNDVLYDAPPSVAVPASVHEGLDALDWRETARHAYATERVLMDRVQNLTVAGAMHPLWSRTNRFHVWRLLVHMEDAALAANPSRRAAILDEIGRSYPALPPGGAGWFRTLFGGNRAQAMLLAPALEQSLTAFDRAQAHTELAKIALALRAYRQATGAYPHTLEELGTELPMADPFSPEGAAYRYMRENGGFRLYSVGDDGEDDGGRGPLKHSDGDLVWCAAQ